MSSIKLLAIFSCIAPLFLILHVPGVIAVPIIGIGGACVVLYVVYQMIHGHY